MHPIRLSNANRLRSPVVRTMRRIKTFREDLPDVDVDPCLAKIIFINIPVTIFGARDVGCLKVWRERSFQYSRYT